MSKPRILCTGESNVKTYRKSMTLETLQVCRQVISNYRCLNKQFDALNALFTIDYEAPLPKAVWSAFDDYVNLAQEAIHDGGGLLSWYIWDNNCGFDGKPIPGGNERIHTLNKLVKYIVKYRLISA